MFVEEARLGAALESPNLAEVRDFIAHRGNYYMVLEWVEGIDLGTWVRWHFERGEAPRWELVAAIGVGVLRGLAAAHERVTRAAWRRRWSIATSARTTSCSRPVAWPS
jgi:serine/threonine protein kinase